MMQGKKIVLWVAAAITVLMLLFPPTLYFIEGTAEQASRFRFEYMFIFSMPEETRINGILLLSQWFGLLLATALVLSLFETDAVRSLLPGNNKPDAASGGHEEDRNESGQ